MTGSLTLENLQISRSGTAIISLDLTIEGGEILTIMGPSGSGKSTLLSALIGALPPAFSQSGRVVLNGRDLAGLPPQERRIGLLFQDSVLFPHLSVGANLAFALPAQIRGRQARREAVATALHQAGLPGYEDRDPATLSGGQRSRIALMRALLAQPCALLLDEPFSRLDAELRAQIRDFTLETVRERSIPTILVTHDIEDALGAGGRILSPMGKDLQV